MLQHPDPEPDRLEKRGRGNPNMKLQRTGVSLNPSGRPKLTQEDRDALKMAREHSPEAIETLIKLMRSAESDTVRHAAACSLLDRAYGKPSQQVLAAHLDIRPEEFDGLAPLDKLSALYGAMIGAQTDEGAYRYSKLVDVTPSTPSRLQAAWPAYDRSSIDAERERQQLRELAEQEAAEQRRRVRRPEPPQPRERVRRPSRFY